MYAQVAIKPNPLLRNGAYGIVMRGVQKCTRGCSSLRGRNKLPLCCIKLDTATEPSVGVGHFFGAMPEEMRGSKLYGVEKDDISGRIAKLLYPKAKIRIDGFEETQFPDNFFDVAVGNIPFGDYKLYDPKYAKHNFRIHDYFFAKALDKVRPDGIVAFVTSKGTLDKANPTVRKYLAERAELIGAVRLPNTAFKVVLYHKS